MKTKKEKQMTETEFLNVLAKTKKAYNWQVGEDGRIFATANNHYDRTSRFTPYGAVLRFSRKQQLNVKKEVAINMTKACFADENRGYCQVLRGRLKKAVGLN